MQCIYWYMYVMCAQENKEIKICTKMKQKKKKNNWEDNKKRMTFH